MGNRKRIRCDLKFATGAEATFISISGCVVVAAAALHVLFELRLDGQTPSHISKITSDGASTVAEKKNNGRRLIDGVAHPLKLPSQ